MCALAEDLQWVGGEWGGEPMSANGINGGSTNDTVPQKRSRRRNPRPTCAYRSRAATAAVSSGLADVPLAIHATSWVANAEEEVVALRMHSVRPKANRRVDPDSYVNTGRLKYKRPATVNTHEPDGAWVSSPGSIDVQSWPGHKWAVWSCRAPQESQPHLARLAGRTHLG